MTDTKDLRNAFGQFATGVCVASVAPAQGQPAGMTINSFSSVSLEPALILWNVQNDADRCAAFTQAESFAISVLTSDQQDLSNFYARKGDGHMEADHIVTGDQGLPLIAGALATFECRTWATYPGGDHTIIVGEVVSFTQAGQGAPLLFHGGRYAGLAAQG